MTLHEAARHYLDETAVQAKANDISQKWVDKQIANVALLEEALDGNLDVAAIKYDVCQQLRKTLAAMPAHRSRLFPKLSLPEAIKAAQSDKSPLLTPTTQQQYLDTFRNILGLCVKREVLRVNPAEDIEPLKRDLTPASQKRLPFTLEQLKSLFSGAFYSACAAKARPYEGDPMGWRFWLPPLCLFMGLRPNEVCQMNASDVKITAAGTVYLDVIETSDEEGEVTGKNLKTLYSRRKIPLHPEMLRLGFVEYANARQALGKGTMLFGGLKPDAYGMVIRSI